MGKIILNKFYFGPFNDNKSALLFLNKKRKNLFFTLTDLKGSVLSSVTTGHFNIKRRKRMSPYTTELMIHKISSFLKLFRITSLDLILKIKSRFLISTVIRLLLTYNYKLITISDYIVTPHNGCRKKKIRRI